jgi:cell division protein FtsQ
MWPLGRRRSDDGSAAALLRYRLGRLWRRRWLRRAVTVQLPALALAVAAAALASDPRVHAGVSAQWRMVREALTARPEFAIRRIEIEGASSMVEAEVRAALTDALGASALDIDADAVRRRVESLGWVRSARVALEAPEALRVAVVERVAAAIWRVNGEPWLIDARGEVIEPAFSRADHPDLPLVVGEGAERAMDEARAILSAAGPLGPRIRGLIRVGDRRWDVALDRDVVLSLPAEGAAAAMARAVQLHRDAALFDRDIAGVDLRIVERPVVRLTERAQRTLADPLTGEEA